MYTFYSSVCNLLGPKQKPPVDVSKSTNLQQTNTLQKTHNTTQIRILKIPPKIL